MPKRVIVAPLNWGLGHATRCIPVITNFLKHGAEVIIASNGNSLTLLQKQFPELQSFQLPGFNPSYPAQGNMAGAMLRQLPKFIFQIEKEKATIAGIVKKTKADVVISDNRYGVRTSAAKNIFISHQLNIQVPEQLKHYHKLINNWQAKYINRFDECWVPDTGTASNLAGNLVNTDKIKIPLYFAGILSPKRSTERTEKKYDIVIILSGPEPQRSILEGILIEQLSGSNLNTLMIRGRISDPQQMPQRGNIEFINYADSNSIAQILHKETIVIARSGYSTIMDLVQMKCKSILIPTPGQTEQEYLAKYLSNKNFIVTQSQNEFNLSAALQKIGTIQEMTFDTEDRLSPLVERVLKN